MTTPTSGGLWRRAPTPLLAASALGVAALLVWAGYAIRGQARVEAAPAAAIAPSSATSDRPVVDPQAQTMKLGMDALYARRDPVAAAARFREVLAMNGEHYGATYQLAVALDLAGAPGASRPLWAKVLAMATAIGDAESAARARARPPPPAPPPAAPPPAPPPPPRGGRRAARPPRGPPRRAPRAGARAAPRSRSAGRRRRRTRPPPR